MANGNGVISSAIYIRALDITEEEKRENEAKFKAWYANFRNTHKEHFEAKQNGQEIQC